MKNTAHNEGNLKITTPHEPLCHGSNGGSVLIDGYGITPSKLVKATSLYHKSSPHNCDNCGGTIHNNICDYCGSQY